MLTVGRSGERGSGISVLPARYDDDDDDDLHREITPHTHIHTQKRGCPGYNAKLYLIVRLLYGDLRSFKYLFIAIPPKSTLTWTDSTC